MGRVGAPERAAAEGVGGPLPTLLPGCAWPCHSGENAAGPSEETLGWGLHTAGRSGQLAVCVCYQSSTSSPLPNLVQGQEGSQLYIAVCVSK